MVSRHPLQDLIEPEVEALGFELVRVLTVGIQNPTLQVMIDRKDGTDIIVDDCAKVSRRLSDVLDEKDPIESEYSLEVSSPGLDRPLTKPVHFARFAGYEAKVETMVEVQGRKRFKGKIISLDEQNKVYFEMEDVTYEIPFDDISKARIVITDELMKKYEEAQETTEI